VLPEVPTMAEAGFPEIEGESWFAVVAPAGTPKDIVAQLNHEIAKAVAAPDVQQRLGVLGYEAVATSIEDCAARFRGEADKWTKVIRASGIRTE
jgi:tripartite-type tricarboxylate transporter receptor subunit TctC